MIECRGDGALVGCSSLVSQQSRGVVSEISSYALSRFETFVVTVMLVVGRF